MILGLFLSVEIAPKMPLYADDQIPLLLQKWVGKWADLQRLGLREFTFVYTN